MDGASTSAAGAVSAGASLLVAVHPETVEELSFALLSHETRLPSAITGVRVRVKLATHWLILRWRIEDAAALAIPPFTGRVRVDGLWRATCFELFVRRPGEAGYAEFNLSPSEAWAAYDFTATRVGMSERPMPRAPVCTFRAGGAVVLFDAALPLAGLPPLPWEIGLSAVLEETGAAKSYWALAHPGDAPDFHHPACFALRVPPPDPL